MENYDDKENNEESDENTEDNNDKDKNLFVLDSLNENKNSCFNIQKYINYFDLKELKKINLKYEVINN